jgi:hypothetical protein
MRWRWSPRRTWRKGTIDADLGLRLTYHPERKVVAVETDVDRVSPNEGGA